MAYVRKADRTVKNETGIPGIEADLTPEELVYCNNLAKIWKDKLEMIPGTTMVRVGTYQGLLEMGQMQPDNVSMVLRNVPTHRAQACNLLVAYGYVVVFDVSS